MDPYDNGNRSSVVPNSNDYEKGKKKITNNSGSSSSGNHKDSGSVTPVTSGSSNANKVIFLGDSRTVQMYAHLTGKWGSANYSSGGVHVVDNDVFIAQGGQGLSWMKSTGIPNIESKSDGKLIINGKEYKKFIILLLLLAMENMIL